jgi:hypothetical protein
MSGSRKSRKEMSVEEFVTGQRNGAPADGGATDKRESGPKIKGWLVAATVVTVGLLTLCFTAFVKIGHLNRDVALLRSQMDEKAIGDLKVQVAALSRDLEAMKQTKTHGARVKTKAPIKKEATDKKKKARPR